MDITVWCFSFVDFTVTNNCLLIAYDDEIHYTNTDVCKKVVLTRVKPAGKIARVKINNLFHT